MLKVFECGDKFTSKQAQKLAKVAKDTDARNSISKLKLEGLLRVSEKVKVAETKKGTPLFLPTYTITGNGLDRLKVAEAEMRRLAGRKDRILVSILKSDMNPREVISQQVQEVIYPEGFKITIAPITWNNKKFEVQKDTHTRMGALAHLDIPSRTGDRYVKYAPPVSMISATSL